MNEIKVLSFAKINLSIDVKGTMESGFHQVDMIMQQLSFHDDVKITFKPIPERESGLEISLSTNRYYLPTDERNLAYKAAKLMWEEYKDRVCPGHISIDITKRIPVAAGMAGGSGNGAAVLHGLNLLWGLNLSLDDLCRLGSQLGSDVPFCIMGQARGNHTFPKKIRRGALATSAARARGTGTELTPINGIRKSMVIAKPALSVSTAEVYKGIDECKITVRPDNDQLVRDLESRDEAKIYKNFVNVLEEYTLKEFPKVNELKILMESTDAKVVLMSGSGPTVFAIYDNIETSKQVCQLLRSKGYEAYWTKTTR